MEYEDKEDLPRRRKIHTQRRAQERLRMNLSDELYRQLCDRIGRGELPLLSSDNLEQKRFFRVEIDGRSVVAVWSSRGKHIVTFLTEEQYADDIASSRLGDLVKGVRGVRRGVKLGKKRRQR